MTSRAGQLKSFFLAAVAVLALTGPRPAVAAGGVLDADAQAALNSLIASSSIAKELGDQAVGILIFPNISKLGFIIGAQGGDGVLLEKDKPITYYTTGALSVGLQVGVQSYGYALFFMTPGDLAYLEKSEGWSVGVDPNIILVNAGAAKDVSTLTGRKGVYAFIYDQRGLMVGVNLVGQKIRKIER